MAVARLQALKDSIVTVKKQDPASIPWDPNSAVFPPRSALPSLPGAPRHAAWVWGLDDQLGRLNLQTPARVLAAKSEIQTGEVVPVNLPLDVPSKPAFGREAFKHRVKTLADGRVFDDTWEINTQSGTQWDGFRHFSHIESRRFYNNASSADFVGPDANLKCSIHHWAEKGIAGRAILLDFHSWSRKHRPNFDPFGQQTISVGELKDVAKEQGLNMLPESQGGHVRPGDVLFVRAGWTSAYLAMSEEQKQEVGGAAHPKLSGLEQSEEMLDWLHDCYFSAIGSDLPSLEAWPPANGWHLHEHILAMWGMPLGEMLDLERLSQRCRELGRYTFFFSSAPSNVKGGVASHINGLAIL